MTETTLPAHREGGRPTLAFLWLLGLPFAAFMIFALGIAFGVRGDDAAILAAALTTGSLALVPLALGQGRPPSKRHTLITLLSLSYLMYFALPVFTGYFWAGTDNMGNLHLTNLLPADVLVGELTALLGLVFLLAGYSSPAGRLVANVLPTPRRDWSHEASLVTALVMIPMGWFVFFVSSL